MAARRAENLRSYQEVDEIIIRLEFLSPVLFGEKATQYWRVPSDTLFRGIINAVVRLFGPHRLNVIYDRACEIALSSLLPIKNEKFFIPNFGFRAYVTPDESDILDPTELLETYTMVRIPRIEGYEPEPFTYNMLLTTKIQWGIMLKAPPEIMSILIPAVRLLGELGIGARKSRGFGKFRVLSVHSPNEYGINLSFKEGILASRYMPIRWEEVKGREIHMEEFTVTFGPKLRYTFRAVAEGSKLTKVDQGKLLFVKNELGHRVPIFLRPLLLLPR